jgi:hypothetical protein
MNQNNYSNGTHPAARTDYELFHRWELERFAALEAYAKWYSLLGSPLSQTYDAVELFTSAHPKLKVLDQLRITRKKYPFDAMDPRLQQAREAWEVGSWDENFNLAKVELIKVLTMLQRTHSYVKNFSHDQLPTIFFTMDVGILDD